MQQPLAKYEKALQEWEAEKERQTMEFIITEKDLVAESKLKQRARVRNNSLGILSSPRGQGASLCVIYFSSLSAATEHLGLSEEPSLKINPSGPMAGQSAPVIFPSSHGQLFHGY